MTQTPGTYAHLDRWIVRCGRGHVALLKIDPMEINNPAYAQCPCGAYRTNRARVLGKVTGHVCGARCTSARGATCDCECGGENHGIDHASIV